MASPRFVQGLVTQVTHQKVGIVSGLLDAKDARLVVPARHEHARRLFFGFAAPITVLRIALRHPATRESLRRRLLPPFFCLLGVAIIAVATGAGHDGSDWADGTWYGAAIARVLAVVAALSVAEWILIWIGREHHDRVAYECAVLTGAPAETMERAPRLRLDPVWPGLKLWRAVRFALFVLLVAPLAWLVSHGKIVGPYFSVGIEAAWAAYWACVFAIANSFVAWHSDSGPWAPWFVRLLDRLGGVPVVGFFVRPYTRLVVYLTRPVWPACMAFEEVPWEAAGLALARGAASIPLVYLLVRPFFGPAATHALVGRRGVGTVEPAARQPSSASPSVVPPSS